MKKFNVICIIPARGGSKGIPGKNIIDFVGKPLIAHSILQALDSKYINEVYVSSDDKNILDISKTYGAIPVKRPKKLSDDFASSESALLHVVTSKKLKPDLIVFLQATSPLRKKKDIDNTIEHLLVNNYDSIFSAVNMKHFFFWEKDENGKMKTINHDYENRKRRQDERREQFIENGSIYVFKPEILIKNNNRLGGNIGCYPMEDWQLFEIDISEDLGICECFYTRNKLGI
jgi:N-acylneuraminate cytidylyltransferase